YVLVFPPVFMNLLLVQAAPSDLLRYFLAGYLVAAAPAAAIALTDEMLARTSAASRAGWCGMVGLLAAPGTMGLLADFGMIGYVQAALSGGVAAFLCALACAKLVQRRAVAEASAE